MSAVAEAAPSKPPGKKKLIIIVAAVIALLGGAAGAYFAMKGKPADAAKEAGKDGDKKDASGEHKRDPKQFARVELAISRNEQRARLHHDVGECEFIPVELVFLHLSALQ